MYLENYPTVHVHRRTDNFLTHVLNQEFSILSQIAPSTKRYTYNLTSNLYSKKDRSNLVKNDWFCCGQPQFTEDALSIVEKSIKKFNLRDK